MDAASVRDAIEAVRPDLVVHLAGQAATGLASSESEATWTVNFGGSFALASAIADFVPNCSVIYASSAEVYGRAFNDGPVTEETPIEPLSTYSRSKAATEWMLADVLPASSRLIVMRPSNHIGAGQTTNFVLPAFAEQIARIERLGGKGAMRVGNLEVERDFLNIRDAVDVYVEVILNANSLPSRNVFNVSSGKLTRISSLLERLCALSSLHIDVEIDPGRWRASEVPRAVIDASKVRELTGWGPGYSLDEAFIEVLNEHRSYIAQDDGARWSSESNGTT
jgi:GDP-4-dehydro-6-deoxy-D-mannose reductase